MSKPKAPRHSNRRSGKLPGKRKAPATTINTPVRKDAGSRESPLKAAHIPDESLCICGHAPTAGGLLASLRAHNASAGGRTAPGGLVPASPRSLPGPSDLGWAFGAVESLRKPFHVEQARVRHQHQHHIPGARGPA